MAPGIRGKWRIYPIPMTETNARWGLDNGDPENRGGFREIIINGHCMCRSESGAVPSAWVEVEGDLVVAGTAAVIWSIETYTRQAER